MSVVHESFTIERRYPSTPAQAFSAFADPSLKKRWFDTPAGWVDARWELDFRVGGTEVHAGGPPGGRHNEFRARFHDIVDGRRIVFAYDLLQDDRLVSVSLTTVEFLSPPDVGTGTLLRFTEQGAFFDDLDTVAQREHGTGLLLTALGHHLAGEPVR